MTGPTELDISALGRQTHLAKGGTASVFLVPDLRLPDFPNEKFVYKKYNEHIKQVAGPALGAGLINFVRFRDRLPPNQRLAWDNRIIWPIALVRDVDGAADGIIMRLIPDAYFQDFKKRNGGINRIPREIETLFGDTETALRTGLPDITLLTRLRLIRAVAAAYGMMHKEGVVLGDISGRNIIYDPSSAQPSILVVDVDSARIRGNRATFGMQPHTPNWQPPEALAASAALSRGERSIPPMTSDQKDRLRNIWSIQSMKTDVYKFGLIVVRILDHRRGGAVSRNPDAAKKILRQQLGSAAEALLDASLSVDPDARPTMRDWYQALQQGRTSKSTSVPASQSQPSVPVKPPPQAGHRVGNWEWVEGQGWVRKARGRRTTP